jgi:single-strand DNA-binding protein
VTVFGQLAENCKKYIKSGSLAYIEGRLSYDVWEKEGIKRSKPKIIAYDVKFLDTPKGIADNTDPCAGPYTPPKNDDTFEGDDYYVLY